METETIFKVAGVIFAIFVFIVLLYKIQSISDASDMTQEALVKELALTADAMMGNDGEFYTNYLIDLNKFKVSADDDYIIVSYGLYPMKYPYFKSEGYELVFQKQGTGILVMEKVKEVG